MHPTLQILRKDIERLWWAVLFTLVLLAVWAFQEATRASVDPFNQPPPVSWLNMGLPFVWSLLIALVLHEDSLVGDRQFWVALPCGWRPLLAAKKAFIVAFIQLPYFLATAAILRARGFNPVSHLPHLLWKQLVLLGLILPVLAAATMVKNLSQFMLLIVTVASGVVLSSTSLNIASAQTDNTWDVRWILALSTLCAGAVVVVMLQFARRFTLRSRVVGVITAFAAASLYSWLPRDTSAAIYVAFSPVQPDPPALSVSLASREPDFYQQRRWYNFQRTTVLLPVTVDGLPFGRDAYGTEVRLDQIVLEMTGANGDKYEADWLNYSNGVRRNRIEARLDELGERWQAISFYIPAVWNSTSRGPVTIHGRILARFYRWGEHTEVRQGERTEIPVGYCSNAFRGDATSGPRTLSTLDCEIAEVAPGDLLVLPTGRLFEHAFYGPSLFLPDPWLSPLRHGTNSIAGNVLATPWTVAPKTLFHAVLIDYTIPNVDLNRYVVHEPVKPEAAK